MPHEQEFYSDSRWVGPPDTRPLDVIDPSTEADFATTSNGGSADIDRTAASAKAAFPQYSRTSKAERIHLLQGIARIYEESTHELANTRARWAHPSAMRPRPSYRVA